MRLDSLLIPPDMNFREIPGLTREQVEKLEKTDRKTSVRLKKYLELPPRLSIIFIYIFSDKKKEPRA